MANGWQTLTFNFTKPGGRHGSAQPGLHLQQGLDLLQLRRDRRDGRSEDLLLRRRCRSRSAVEAHAWQAITFDFEHGEPIL